MITTQIFHFELTKMLSYQRYYTNEWKSRRHEKHKKAILFTCLRSTLEIVEKGGKYVQSK